MKIFFCDIRNSLKRFQTINTHIGFHRKTTEKNASDFNLHADKGPRGSQYFKLSPE